jgi:hypothetical protein
VPAPRRLWAAATASRWLSRAPAANAGSNRSAPSRPLRIPLHERQPGEPGQAQGHELGAAGRQAQVQRLLQQGLDVLQPARTRVRVPSSTWEVAVSQALSSRTARSRASVRWRSASS